MLVKRYTNNSPLHYLNPATKDPVEYMSWLNEYRFKKLISQIKYVWTNKDYYRQRFLEAGVTHPNDVRSLDDFRMLPIFLDKNRHRESQDASLIKYGHPLGLHLTVAPEKAIHLAATSGTTGTPTFYVFSAKDQDITNRVMARLFRMAGIRPGDTTFHAFGLSLWLAGITYIQALEAYGARPISVGAEGGVAKILRFIALTRPRVLFATPSMVTQLIERSVKELGKPVGELGIEIIYCCGEPGASQQSFRQLVREHYGAQVFDSTGAAWHNGTITCHADLSYGMHYMSEDYCFRYDLVDPETRLPIELKDGAVGEAIHTALEYEAAPAFRYATGDIIRIHVGECPGCGHFGVRMEIIGRVDDMLAIKGVKVYPAAIQKVVRTFQPELSGELRIQLDAPPPKVNPPLNIMVEAAAELPLSRWHDVATRLENRVRELLNFRPHVEVVAYGSIPRTGAKAKLIEIIENKGKNRA
ncbi:phenylacetate--CoA ligase [Affinibrenneria salicis]|uniref:Phenylacetate--CoA ligase n=1 Tax=Affinibrenneria salicis TaxID=2590031 RepID=A0A5J5G239_9GAMM|nr:phenylacetate--CoA ligase [Affinibrenneria salicis]KAA9000552.1 phenylacetate--CoA ligase [Affinibrenneria salicis]